jgi:hypothetical protein
MNSRRRVNSTVIPQHDSNPIGFMRFKTYFIVFVVVLIVMVAANYNSYLRMQRAICDDCFLQFGWPFGLWEEGGFVTVKRILWAGLVADLSIAVWAVMFLGWVSSKLLRRGSLRPNNDAA